MKNVNLRKIRLAILVSKFNLKITSNLLKCCENELLAHGIHKSNIQLVWVPGAYELPYVANKMARKKKFDAIICLGCVIKGETSHDLFVSAWAAIGIGQVSLKTGVPTFFGVLTPKSDAQALKRAKPGPLNRGKEVAEAALEIIHLKQKGLL
ncbi:MAG: 6,7-dimethyl-8-ribityllumazine synthase [Elusimicrobia bacterium]|nr:6,7-dimethyl-8-ribityllumazine synthase [Elusimicrobiota bacterium]